MSSAPMAKKASDYEGIHDVSAVVAVSSSTSSPVVVPFLQYGHHHGYNEYEEYEKSEADEASDVIVPCTPRFRNLARGKLHQDCAGGDDSSIVVVLSEMRDQFILNDSFCIRVRYGAFKSVSHAYCSLAV